MLTLGLGVLLVIAARSCVVAQFFACDIPKNVTLVTPSNESNAIITQAEMEVYLDVNSIWFCQERSDGMTDHRKFRADQVKVVLRGYLETPGGNGNGSREDPRQVGTTLEKIIEHFDGSMSGTIVYDRTTLNSDDLQSAELLVPEDCYVNLLLTWEIRPGKDGAGTGPKVVYTDAIPSTVRRLAESCVQSEICPKIRSSELTNGSQTSLGRFKRKTNPSFKERVLRLIINGFWHTRKRRAFRLPKIRTNPKTDTYLNEYHIKQFVACGGKLLFTTTFLDTLNCEKSFIRRGNNYTFDIAFRVIELSLTYKKTKYLLNGVFHTGEFSDTISDVVVKLGFTVHWDVTPANVTLKRLDVWSGRSLIVVSSLDEATAAKFKDAVKKATAETFDEISKLTADPEFRMMVASNISSFIEPFRFLFFP